jgi:hypothetical protein
LGVRQLVQQGDEHRFGLQVAVQKNFGSEVGPPAVRTPLTGSGRGKYNIAAKRPNDARRVGLGSSRNTPRKAPPVSVECFHGPKTT